jgi:hypothetical protein
VIVTIKFQKMMQCYQRKIWKHYFFAKPISLPYNINYRLDCVIFLEAVIAIE